ncbi:OPT superfamily oligopeptide transporter [Hyaloscypha variabilis]|uniref:OPT superfamily oligopeptide transporter n=1 Tax=Hyaloscypha variabilis (strain UAMH 11265 / GT02V1 / F) TaxID=1149755 RepID=A0A2J6QTB8_HYAVF|nr:OPT superfamily oligopeptide transporter [Hyaloscypha variabilis F]
MSNGNGLEAGDRVEKSLSADPSTSELVSNSDASSETAVQDARSNSSQSVSSPKSDYEIFKEKAQAQESAKEVNGDDAPEIDDSVNELPWAVRRVVSLHDDTTLPTITFRYFLLVALFVSPGAFLEQINQYRSTSAPYSIFFVQIAASYVGDWCARYIPALEVKIPFTKWSFNTNPGPFSVKEHVLVVIAANAGAYYNLAFTPISLAEVYFGQRMNSAVALFFMLAIVWTGYSYAAIARHFLIYDPQQPWYHALCQTALFETQTKQREYPSPVSRKQTIVFFSVIIGVTLWQFLPEFVFPLLSSLAFLCWVAPKSSVANFMGSGLGGMGFLNFTFDWSNINAIDGMGNLFVTPWYTQVVAFAAFVVNCWILLPLAQWGKLAVWKHYLMSNDIYLQNGTEYPATLLVTPQMTLNETAYAEYGAPYVGAQQLWNMFFDYASYTSVLMWMVFFGYSHIMATFSKFIERWKSRGKKSVYDQYTDPLNVIMRSYEEVPLWWYIALFLVSFVIVIVLLACGFLYIPMWTYFIALLTGAVVVIPLGWLYGISNFQLPTGTTNELLYGLMVNAGSGHKSPIGASIYGSIAGDAWYRAQYLLQDQKLGHYMHIPPKAVFFSQMMGTMVGVPINYGAIRWVLNSKMPYLDGTMEDPNHQWTGQQLAGSLTTGVQYVLVGPKELFSIQIYKPLPYGFLMGAVTPALLYLLSRRFPKAQFHLWNCTIFFCGLSNFYGNISTGYLSSIIGGFIVMYWAYRKKYELWARYNYILGAAFDSGYNLNQLLLFLFFGTVKTILMPNWWGNSAGSVEKCYALPPDN